jgi:hypothetical protein
MSTKTSFLVAVTVLASIAASMELSTNAQGLKGAQMPKEILGRLVYVKGNNDHERWKTFLGVQPKLIGMTFEQMDKALSGQASHRAMTEVEYGLTQDPVKAGSDVNSWLHVRIFLRNGVVWKYVVEAEN